MRYIALLLLSLAGSVMAQTTAYDVYPPADPPYYRVKYAASKTQGELRFGANYTVWIPPGVRSLRGVVVHQHGCGEGSCKSGLTGAYDLHWQALAKKHSCALLSPTYEQPEKEDCHLWCDPRNGSDAAFQKALKDLGALSGHPELSQIPWALWGHSGGGLWAGGMTLLHPDRVAAAWLRSGVPQLQSKAGNQGPYAITDLTLQVPLMCNLGVKEGVSLKSDGFAGVWPGNQVFFASLRSKGALIGIAIDPLSSHECGNQRYMAIPWLDACLAARLPSRQNRPLKPMRASDAWLATVDTNGVPSAPVPSTQYAGELSRSVWLPNKTIALAWSQYVKDTAISDSTPPPSPTGLHIEGNELRWNADADVESGLAQFIIERDGAFLANVPEKPKNPFGRPLFQNLQYSDTPPQPLASMRYTDTSAEPGKRHRYRVIAVNTVGLKSK